MAFFKKHDLIIYALVLILLVCSFFLWGSALGATGDYAVISVNGHEEARLPLSSDAEEVIEGFAGLTCRILIKDGAASVIEADCPDKLCVGHSPISRSGDSIVCLPARITVTILGTEDSEVDGVAR
ncbi:MAG: NusG domain II-containing protein [Lachnospiraceae bacterium]|nr:NusG domain II-containing protein [Lachnospiraceae bacterium]